MSTESIADQGLASGKQRGTQGKAGASGIQPRRFTEPFGSMPRHWLGGSALATHVANGVNLLFPAGERFFVRSVRRYLAEIDNDPELKAAVRAFAQQEGHHAHAHERLFAELEAQGYAIKPFLRGYEAVAYGFIERVTSDKLHLATTAAAEHFTALLAEGFLTRDVAGLMPDSIRRLFSWHAAEEIEHRAVAYEVLQRVDPSYPLRIAGLAMASATLAGFWAAATISLLLQEEDPLAAVRRGRQEMREQHPFGIFSRGIRAYIKRDFHPSQATHLDELAARYLREAGLAGGGEAPASVGGASGPRDA